MKRLGWTLVFVAAPYFAGCGNSGGTADKKTNEAPSQQVASSAPTNPSAGTAKPTVEMTPAAEVVAQFLDSVRRGDESTVASLLTTEAIAELNKLNIEIDPPGSPEAAFEIGKTEYTDEEKDAAYVELAWIEPVEGSAEKKRNEALFVVRKDQVGWRIAGMVIDAGEGQEPEVIDFENMSQHLVPETPAANTAAVQPPATPTNLQTPTMRAPSGQTAGTGFAAPNNVAAPNGFAIPNNAPTNSPTLATPNAGNTAPQIAAPPSSGLRPIR